jgi:hypothetical protein
MRNFPFFLALLFAATASGQSVPIIRAKLVPATNVLVGQPVRLEVGILVPNYFTGAPTFPQFELDAAIVTLSDDRPEHLNEQINGVTYAGIRRFYLIYPEKPSEFRIPPVEISVPYAAAPPATTIATMHLPTLNFHATLPPEGRDLDYFLPTSQLAIKQKWSNSLNNLRVGDSVARTIVVTTEKMQAMLIPPMQLTAPEGVRVYPKNPSVEDQKSANGVFTQGVRTETASYLFTKPGDFILPEIKITWWDLSTKKLATSKLPATKIQIADTSAYVSELPPQQEIPAAAPPTAHRNWRHYLPIATIIAAAFAILALLAWAATKWSPKLSSHYRAIIYHRRESEPTRWRRLKQAANQNNAPQSYALLLSWLRSSHQPITVDEFQRQANDPTLNEQIAILSQTLFASTRTTTWNGRLFYQSLAPHRQIATPTKSAASHLPALNPTPNTLTP